MMLIDQEASERLAVLRFPLIVGVVFIHAYSTQIGVASGVIGVAEPAPWSDFFRNLISEGIARIAVPLFFLISGYFFFLKYTGSPDSYLGHLRSRSKTLLVPFLFWNVLTLSLYASAQALPLTKSLFTGVNTPVASYNLYEYFNAIIGIEDSPIAYQFWFIRDLMVLAIASPFFYLILKFAPKTFLLLFSFLWFLQIWPVYFPSATAVAFFYIGAFCSHRNISLFLVDRFGVVITFTYLFILLADVMSKQHDFGYYIHKCGLIFGIMTVLFLSKKILNLARTRSFLLWASACSFFVFAVHEPSLIILKKILYFVIRPDDDASILALYLLIPIIIISLSILLYIIMKHLTPRFLAIISGGR